MKKITDNCTKPYLSEISSLSPLKNTSTALVKSFGKAITPLQLPDNDRDNDWDCLLVQAQRINQMAAQLEAMILEFKTIASKLQEKGKPYKSICQYLPVSVPWVIQKPDESFILTMQKVDIFQAERQAAQLAQQLRQHSKSKEERSH
ncbi:hypothetical protein H6G41_18875 [Tolypothrix sp. FACHB-123]|uniref:hypothetical protein n=1 Tax=Tolypothrix sp. FACHB-123 TaxID=2692868 RepID=UPI00168A1F73|nr:hypothetical protein [Tolypothrix sp. FACHB-123]MBD2356665.1 hypothetical protein [Tolypothrix sp. FACHB-123]